MKIEKIESTASRDRVKLCFDDGSDVRVPVSVMAELGLYAGLSVAEEDLAAIREHAGQASAKLRAVRIVAASGVSERELRRRLVQKGENPGHADQAVQWLNDLNLLDDQETARQIVAKGAAKGYGKARVRQMLYEKGIDRELWEDALSALPEPNTAIDRYINDHLGPDPDQKAVKKITDALLRRGHSWEDIRNGLSRYRMSIEEE